MNIHAPALILAHLTNNKTSLCHVTIEHDFRYHQGTTNYGLKITLGDINISVFVDPDHENNETDRKSMSGFIIKTGNASCVWGVRNVCKTGHGREHPFRQIL